MGWLGLEGSGAWGEPGWSVGVGGPGVQPDPAWFPPVSPGLAGNLAGGWGRREGWGQAGSGSDMIYLGSLKHEGCCLFPDMFVRIKQTLVR